MNLSASPGIEASRPVAGEASLAAEVALSMDQMAQGIVIAAADGRLLHANQAARFELGRRRTLEVHQGRLHACLTARPLSIQNALARAAAGQRSLVEFTAREGAPLAVAILPLRAHVSSPAHAALLFARTCVCDPLMQSMFARSHGLTGTEEQVLGLLCQGGSAPDIAVQMNVAVSTIRTHVRSICAKTSSSSVRALVCRVAVLPALAAPCSHEPMH
jgi:DNA-binding CsgD family transcriptional regulator